MTEFINKINTYLEAKPKKGSSCEIEEAVRTILTAENGYKTYYDEGSENIRRDNKSSNIST